MSQLQNLTRNQYTTLTKNQQFNSDHQRILLTQFVPLLFTSKLSLRYISNVDA